jgi:hypothetical protein
MKRIICISLILLAACSQKITNTTAVVSETVKESVMTNVVEGQKIYQANCGRCHELPNPAALSQTEWKPIMERMCRKARFSEAEKMHASAYVMANAKN